MNFVKIVLNVLISGLVIATVLGAYVLFRYAQTPNGAEINQLFSQKRLHDVTPTMCTYDSWDLNSQNVGLLLVYDGQVRYEWAGSEDGAFGELRAVITRDGTYLVDRDTIDTIPWGDNQQEMIDSYITSSVWDCYPWWFPKQSLFDVPT